MSAHLTVDANTDYGKLFQPDELTEAQYLAANRRRRHGQPELQLMAAVLEDAVATLLTDQRRCSSRQRRDFAEALNWINGRTDQRSIFSFNNICEALALGPSYLRQGLMRKTVANRDHKPATGVFGNWNRSPRRKIVRLRAS